MTLKEKRPTKEQKFVKTKFVPSAYEFPSTVIIYGEKVAILVWEKNPVAFLLESKQAVISFLNYFNILWKIAKRQQSNFKL